MFFLLGHRLDQLCNRTNSYFQPVDPGDVCGRCAVRLSIYPLYGEYCVQSRKLDAVEYTRTPFSSNIIEANIQVGAAKFVEGKIVVHALLCVLFQPCLSVKVYNAIDYKW